MELKGAKTTKQGQKQENHNSSINVGDYFNISFYIKG